MEAVTSFLDRIGIIAREGEVPHDSFLQGVCLEMGEVVYDIDRLLSPGDILHEAGHIALTPAIRRSLACGNIAETAPEDEGLERAVICWTWFAAREIGLPLEVLFHPEGYKGDSEWLIEQFENHRLLGLPLLQWKGMVVRDDGDSGIPRIVKWLSD